MGCRIRPENRQLKRGGVSALQTIILKLEQYEPAPEGHP
jgi:hypothetical protein